MPHRLVFLGPPGVGKGTQADLLAAHLKIPHISTGDILRSLSTSDSPLAATIRKYLDEGRLIPDDLMTRILTERLEGKDTERGFILDGYPRTLPQAEALQKAGIEIDKVLYFTAPEETLIKRITGRLTCPSCNSVFNIEKDGVREGCVCPSGCGTELRKRSDDREDIVRERLHQYAERTAPLVEYYRRLSLLVEINSSQSPAAVFQELLRKLG